MEFRWLATAFNDLKTHRQALLRDNPDIADRVILHVLAAIEQLLSRPELGTPGRIPGTYELYVDGVPFIVVYRMRAGRFEILRLLRN